MATCAPTGDSPAVSVTDAPPVSVTDAPPVSVTDALRALGGTARWKQLRGHVGWRALAAARAGGQVGFSGSFYFLIGTSEDIRLAGVLRGVRSHTTAAVHHGFALPPDDGLVRLTVPPNAHRASDRRVRLSFRSLSPSEVVGDVTTGLRTVVDCLRDEDFRVALSVGDSALRSGAVTRDELVAAVTSLHGRGARLARDRAAMLDARSANAFESCARAILIVGGVTGFVPQVTIRHDGQFVGRADLADRRRQIVIECDGFEFHAARPAFIKDLTRFTMLVAGGWRPLRFTWEQVMFQPGWVLARVREVVALAEPGAVTEERRRFGGSRRAA